MRFLIPLLFCLSLGAQALPVSGSGPVEVPFEFVKVVHQPPAPAYPALARLARIQGTVVVELVVGGDGIPTQARALEGPAQLRATAEEYALAWKFSPRVKDGQPVPYRFKLTMPFLLKGGVANPRRQAVLQVEVDAPGLEFDPERLLKRAEDSLLLLDVAPVEAAKADPAKTSSAAIDLKVTRQGPEFYFCEASLRVSLMKDLMFATNVPGQPPQVWYKRLACGHRGKTGLTQTLAMLIDRVLISHFSADRTLRYASPAEKARSGVPAGSTFTPPSIRDQPSAPASPPEARSKGVQGNVKVDVTLDPQGRPVRIWMVSGPPELEAAALAYALAVTYEPARVDGVAWQGQILLTVPFT
jgi:TonB family protein